MNMSIAKPIIATGLVEPVGINNLDLYIPRVDEKYSEEEIKFIFADIGIGIVNYVDFVATKDPETKQIKFYSAFLRLKEWNPYRDWYKMIIVEKQNRIQITRTEFWVILPAKTPLSRSKVNTHQLAAYTDELYVRVETIEKSVAENITVSSTHFQNLLAKSEAQVAQIDQLMKIVQIQAEQLARISDVLFKNQVEEEIRKPRALTIEDLGVPETNTDDISSQAEKKSPTYCDDECFFFKPLNTETTRRSPIIKKTDIISGSFSCDIEEVLGPVAKSMGLTREEVRKGLQEEWANSQRVKGSINYCGNE
jgi:hypothetical protein